MAEPQSLRLTTVITTMAFGGAQRILVDALSRLPTWVRREVIALYPGPMANALRSQHVPLIEYDDRGLRTWRAIPRLTAYLRRARPHIVHTHMAKADFVGRLAARLAGVPLVVSTIHHYVEQWHANPLLTFLEKQSMRLADVIIANSRATRDALIARGVAEERLRISYARAELRERFENVALPPERRRRMREELAIREGTVVSIMIGQMYPRKAQELALEALALMSRPERPHVLVIVGDGPLREALEHKAKSILRPTEYRFLGSRADVHDLLRLADIYVMPSRFESAGLALVEALAAGLPAVVTDIPGMREVVDSCGGALTFPAEDAQAMAASWETLVCDPAKRKALAVGARDRALNKWDIRELCREYLTCYADACAGSDRIDRATLPRELFDLRRHEDAPHR